MRRSIAVYREAFERYASLPWDAVRSRAGGFVDAIDAYDVELLPEIEGIAEGAGVDAEDVLALNLRTEVMFGMGAPECTAVCALGGATADGHVLLAQNWDWKPASADTVVLLACAPSSRPGFVTLVEAGLLAKCGMNEAGIGLATNALESSLDRGAPGVPFHAVLRRVLTSASFEAAVGAVTRADRASSANYLVAHRDGRSSDIEATPEGTILLAGDVLAHANHFLWRGRRFKDLGVLAGGTTRSRQDRAEASMEAGRGSHSIDGILRVLVDHAGGVCAHRDPSVDEVLDYVTIASVAMDLTDGVVWVSDGPPCRSPLRRLEVGALLAAARERSLARTD